MIINNITGQMYIGQSKDIENRYKEHIYHKNTTVGQAIHQYGVENFTFEVLEECSVENLDKEEKYWIKYFNTTYPEYGYNKIQGGQDNIGESNGRVILSEKEVYDIREDYNNHISKKISYEKYKDKIAWYSFSNIWEGYSWQHIHYDVYTEENKLYYMKGTSLGENGKSAIFTDKEVLELRNRYINESAASIYESVKNRCGFQTLQQILWGRHYSHLPIYDKKHKRWINN